MCQDGEDLIKILDMCGDGHIYKHGRRANPTYTKKSVVGPRCGLDRL